MSDPTQQMMGEDGQRLMLRVDQMERSVNRILPIVRKILFTVSERPASADTSDASVHAPDA